jgi:putative heme transporter
MTDSVPSANQLVPVWLSNVAALGWRVLVVLALGALVLDLLVVMFMVTATLILSACVVAAVAPVVADRRARGWSRAKAAAYGSGIAALAATVAVAFTVLAFVPYIPDVVAALQAGLQDLSQQLAAQSAPTEAISAVQSVAAGALQWVLDAVGAIVSSAATAVTILILAAFLTFYLLLDGDRGWASLVGSVDGWRRERLTSGGEVALERLGSFVRGTALLATLNAIAVFVLMLVLGLPYGGPVAVVFLFGGLVPYVGLVVATGAAVLVALGTGATLKAIALVAGIVIVNVLVDRMVVPRVLGERVKVHPAVALVAIPVGAAVAGLFGVVFAVPVMVPIVAVSGSIVAVLNQQKPSPQGVGIVPVWLDRIAQWSWRLLVILAVLVGAIALVAQLPLIVMPVILAGVLAPMCLPVVRWLEGRGLNRVTSALATILGATLITGVVLWLAFVALAGSVTGIASDAADGASQANAAAQGRLEAIESIAATLGPSVTSAVRFLTVTAVLAFLATVLIGLVLSYYLLIDGGRGWQFATGRLSMWRRRRLDDAAERAVGVLGGYMFGTAIVSGFGAITQWALMTLLGLPLALPLAVLSFFACFIPYIGGFVTTGLAFLVALSTGDQLDIIVMGVFTVVFNIVQGNVLQPLVYGKVASLHPAVVLMAIPAAGAVAGIIGMFLVVPLLGVVSVSWQTILGTFGNEESAGVQESAPTKLSASPAAAGLATATGPPETGATGPPMAQPATATEPQAGRGGV